MGVSLFIWSVIKVALLGSLAALDRTAALQLMLSRPLVAALWAGWLAGNWEIGLLLGACLELYFLPEIPVGTNIPTDDTLLAIAAGGAAATISQTPAGAGLNPGSLVFLALLTVLPWAPLTRCLDGWVRSGNSGLIDEVETRLLAGEKASALNFHLHGMFNFYGAAVVAVGSMMALALLLLPVLVWLLPVWLYPWSDRLLLIFPLAGAAGLLGNMNRKTQLTVFAGTVVLLLFFVV
ncbi:MAG TPA: hypothetical protein ENN66_11395 [Proteobacteria bacterium]|nr:hypothetical protein [Pseudomonadota bacterium]